MNKHQATASVYLLLAILFVAGRAGAKELELQDLPDSVRATIEAKADGGEITEIEMERHGEEMIYEAEVQKDGREIDIMVSRSGEFLGYEDDANEDEGEHDGGVVRMEDLPAAVQKKASEIVGANEVMEIEKETEDGFTDYEIGYMKDGMENCVKLSAEGEIMEQESEISPHDLPAAVQRILKSKYAKANIKDAEMSCIYLYEIEIEQDGEMVEVVFLASGKVLNKSDKFDDDEDDDEHDGEDMDEDDD